MFGCRVEFIGISEKVLKRLIWYIFFYEKDIENLWKKIQILCACQTLVFKRSFWILLLSGLWKLIENLKVAYW